MNNRERDQFHSSKDHSSPGSSFSQTGMNSGGNAFKSQSTSNYHKQTGPHEDDSVHGTDNSHRPNAQDSTLIKNAGDWYVGLPPGSAVRAHVQSIDLLPLGGRPPSPSEALRRDKRRSKQY